MKKYRPGKIPWIKVAKRVRTHLPPEVILGPAQGEDAALVKLGGEVWAVASDPITFTSHEAGTLSVIVNANDVIVRGALPRFFTAVVLVAPDEADEARVAALLDQIRTACNILSVGLIGGHTEVTPGLRHSIIVGTMLGRVTGRPITTGGLQPGDLVGMTRHAGLEGTAILKKEFADLFDRPHGEPAVAGGMPLCIVAEAAGAAACDAVSALHDVTEGGVGEALHEMAQASGCFIDVDEAAVPVLDDTRTLCAALGMNPFGLIGSGSLLVGCAPGGKEAVEAAMVRCGVRFAWIGQAADADGAPRTTLPRFERDEILKAWLLDGLEACVFDMDGTLIDSRYDWVAIKDALGTHGGSIIDELNSFNEPERSTKWRILQDIEHEATRAAGVKEGAADLLAHLKRKGIKTALVTNNSDDNVRYLLEKFDLAFDVVLSRDSGFYKPSGAPVAEAVRRLGARRSKTLCVGDSRYDILACRDARCAAVCILHDTQKRFSPEGDIDFPDIAAFRRYLDLVLPADS